MAMYISTILVVLFTYGVLGVSANGDEQYRHPRLHRSVSRCHRHATLGARSHDVSVHLRSREQYDAFVREVSSDADLRYALASARVVTWSESSAESLRAMCEATISSKGHDEPRVALYVHDDSSPRTSGRKLASSLSYGEEYHQPRAVVSFADVSRGALRGRKHVVFLAGLVEAWRATAYVEAWMTREHPGVVLVVANAEAASAHSRDARARHFARAVWALHSGPHARTAHHIVVFAEDETTVACSAFSVNSERKNVRRAFDECTGALQ